MKNENLLNINDDGNIKIENIRFNEKEFRTTIRDEFENERSNKEMFHNHLFDSNFVHIREIDAETGELKNEEKSKNLILFRGRTWLLQRAANLSLGMANWNDTSAHPYPAPNLRNCFISWFGLGSGGHYELDLFRIKGVKNTDNDLTIWARNIPDDSITYNNSTVQGNILYYKIPLNNNDFIWRQYHKISSIEILTDAELQNTGTYKALDDNNQYKNFKVDSYIVLKVSTVIQAHEYNAKNSNYEGQILSEAGLFVSNTGTAVPTYPPIIIAKTYFPAKLKDSGTILVFDWYLYF